MATLNNFGSSMQKGYDFADLMRDSMDDRILHAHDGSVWKLTKPIKVKRWLGHETKGHPQFAPSELHAVYEAVQLEGGAQPGLVAIIKIRVEVPLNHEALEPPEERAKYAADDGLSRFNGYTERETVTLEALTAAHCSVTPELYLIQLDSQDESILHGKDGDPYWMPGGYIVYIIMQKLPAVPLDCSAYWNNFSEAQRTEIRGSFREGCLELWRLGYRSEDEKVENLMWNDVTEKCYFVDLEAMYYDPICLELATQPWRDTEFVLWQLARRSNSLREMIW